MKNIEMIASAIKAFDKKNLIDAKKILNRISNNFSIEHDEYSFNIETKIYQPYKETAEKLQPEIIGDTSFDTNKYKIKIRITCKAFEPNQIRKGDPDIDIKDEPLFFNASYRIDYEGIACAVIDNNSDTEHKETKAIIKKWFKQEFGVTESWN